MARPFKYVGTAGAALHALADEIKNDGGELLLIRFLDCLGITHKDPAKVDFYEEKVSKLLRRVKAAGLCPVAYGDGSGSLGVFYAEAVREHVGDLTKLFNGGTDCYLFRLHGAPQECPPNGDCVFESIDVCGHTVTPGDGTAI